MIELMKIYKGYIAVIQEIVKSSKLMNIGEMQIAERW